MNKKWIDNRLAIANGSLVKEFVEALREDADGLTKPVNNQQVTDGPPDAEPVPARQ